MRQFCVMYWEEFVIIPRYRNNTTDFENYNL